MLTSGRTESVHDAPTTHDHKCRDAEPTKHTQPFNEGKGSGDRDLEFYPFLFKRLFRQADNKNKIRAKHFELDFVKNIPLKAMKTVFGQILQKFRLNFGIKKQKNFKKYWKIRIKSVIILNVWLISL